MSPRRLTIGSIALTLGMLQLLEAVRPGLISGPLNIGFLWVGLTGLLAVAMSRPTNSRPEDPLDR